MKNKIIILIFTIFIHLALSYTVPPADLPSPPYGEWAHYHWIWMNGTSQNQQNLINMVNGYLQRNISVGVLGVDSAWSQGITNFKWDLNKFPDPQAFISYLHSRNIRLTCWTTSFVNNDSSNYAEALQNHYLLNNGKLLKWHHGFGALLDYTNEEAVQWWHQQMRPALEMGIDGWKTDYSDQFIRKLIYAHGKKGHITHKEYANLYYGDFFNFTREVKGIENGLIMSRPVEGESIFYFDFSPKYVVFSGWVGDQQDSFSGLKVALRSMFHSAWEGYTNFGSDIGGYQNKDARGKELFLRWTQMGALVPLMENGGKGNHLPWQFDEETVEIYRKFVNIHYEFVPYFYTAGAEAYENKKSVMQPVYHKQLKVALPPKYYDYLLWNDVLISPVVDAVDNIDVHFPKKHNWVDYWNTSIIYKGGKKIKNYPVPLNKSAIFWRQGAIIPLNVTSDDSQYGSQNSQGYLTVVIPSPIMNSKESKGVRQSNNGGIIIDYEYTKKYIQLVATQFQIPLIFIITGLEYNNDITIQDVVRENNLQQFSNYNEFQQSKVAGFLIDQTINRLYIKSGISNQGWIFQILGLSKHQEIEEIQ